ncbi:MULTISPECIES: type II toxin-antitoxin system HicB family antitoxin [Rhodanobacter]|uniref:type II toxin-antitoxin system HicB family antitoxin n=1 Tax=Rhodanobacter TaxID=75309 RepID=UPI00041D8727|nr:MULTISPECIES: type II toxin-antitoxin system HicB family antitoxin [Rhodanobacter]UJJ59048.1 type II toxin-antitoxin system HicB family antitoxin [Rhodanobacter denitrificans]
MKFPVKLTRADSVVMVTCPDLPEFSSVGDTEGEALREAVDGIETTLQAYMQDRRDIPPPGARKRGQRLVELPPLAVAKLGLYRAMREQGLRKADLARRLDVHLPQVDRLLDLRHSSKLEQVEAALNALGYRIELAVLAA